MSAEIIQLWEHNSTVAAPSGKELADWLRSYADHIEDPDGEYADTCDIVLLLHTDRGQLHTCCTSKQLRMDTVYVVGLLSTAATRKANNPGVQS